MNVCINDGKIMHGIYSGLLSLLVASQRFVLFMPGWMTQMGADGAGNVS